jgi:hypothetical protein
MGSSNSLCIYTHEFLVCDLKNSHVSLVQISFIDLVNIVILIFINFMNTIK